MSLPSHANYNLYTSVRKRVKSSLRHGKNSIINMKYQKLTNLDSFKDIWHLPQNLSHNFTSSPFLPLIKPDGSDVTSIFKAELLVLTFSQNSSQDDFGHIPPTYPFSDLIMPLTLLCQKKSCANRTPHTWHPYSIQGWTTF